MPRSPATGRGIGADAWNPPGAPLLAREYEQRTHLLAWSQDVRPTRWLLVRAGLLALITAALSIALVIAVRVALTTLERANIGGDGFNGAWDTHPFEATLPLAVGYTFVGLALGMGVGALVRRTVPAMGITLAAFVFVRAVLQRFRPHFLPPRTWDDPLGDRGGLFRADPDALIVGRELVDTAGRSVDWSAMPVQCNTADSAEQASACYREAGLVAERISYQPSSRVWTFQLIETGIVAALALIAITITWYAVRRRRTIS